MNIVINPKYQQLTTFIKEIPTHFEKEGEMIYEARNQLKAYHIEGLDIIVKSFKKPNLINRIAYTYFRSSKAKRSFEHGQLLLKKDVSTPEPIAYIEEKEEGLLNRSYYISVFEKEYSEIRKHMLGECGDDNFIKDLAAFIADLHNKGILQNDLSPGNILYKTENNKTLFSLVDINRTSFLNSISKKKRFKNFERICEKQSIINCLAREYAKVCNLNADECVRGINKYIVRYSKNYNI